MPIFSVARYLDFEAMYHQFFKPEWLHIEKIPPPFFIRPYITFITEAEFRTPYMKRRKKVRKVPADAAEIATAQSRASPEKLGKPN